MRLASGACCMSKDCIPSKGGNIQKKPHGRIRCWRFSHSINSCGVCMHTFTCRWSGAAKQNAKAKPISNLFEKRIRSSFIRTATHIQIYWYVLCNSADLSQFSSNPQFASCFHIFRPCGAEVSNKVSSKYGAPQLSAGLARQFEALYLRWQSDGFGHSHLAQMCFLDQFWD